MFYIGKNVIVFTIRNNCFKCKNKIDKCHENEHFCPYLIPFNQIIMSFRQKNYLFVIQTQMKYIFQIKSKFFRDRTFVHFFLKIKPR